MDEVIDRKKAMFLLVSLLSASPCVSAVQTTRQKRETAKRSSLAIKPHLHPIARRMEHHAAHVRPHQNDPPPARELDVLRRGRIGHGIRIEALALILDLNANLPGIHLADQPDVLPPVSLVPVPKRIGKRLFNRQPHGKGACGVVPMMLQRRQQRCFRNLSLSAIMKEERQRISLRRSAVLIRLLFVLAASFW